MAKVTGATAKSAPFISADSDDTGTSPSKPPKRQQGFVSDKAGASMNTNESPTQYLQTSQSSHNYIDADLLDDIWSHFHRNESLPVEGPLTGTEKAALRDTGTANDGSDVDIDMDIYLDGANSGPCSMQDTRDSLAHREGGIERVHSAAVEDDYSAIADYCSTPATSIMVSPPGSYLTHSGQNMSKQPDPKTSSSLPNQESASEATAGKPERKNKSVHRRHRSHTTAGTVGTECLGLGLTGDLTKSVKVGKANIAPKRIARSASRSSTSQRRSPPTASEESAASKSNGTGGTGKMCAGRSRPSRRASVGPAAQAAAHAALSTVVPSSHNTTDTLNLWIDTLQHVQVPSTSSAPRAAQPVQSAPLFPLTSPGTAPWFTNQPSTSPPNHAMGDYASSWSALNLGKMNPPEIFARESTVLSDGTHSSTSTTEKISISDGGVRDDTDGNAALLALLCKFGTAEPTSLAQLSSMTGAQENRQGAPPRSAHRPMPTPQLLQTMPHNLMAAPMLNESSDRRISLDSSMEMLSLNLQNLRNLRSEYARSSQMYNDSMLAAQAHGDNAPAHLAPIPTSIAVSSSEAVVDGADLANPFFFPPAFGVAHSSTDNVPTAPVLQRHQHPPLASPPLHRNSSEVSQEVLLDRLLSSMFNMKSASATRTSSLHLPSGPVEKQMATEMPDTLHRGDPSLPAGITSAPKSNDSISPPAAVASAPESAVSDLEDVTLPIVSPPARKRSKSNSSASRRTSNPVAPAVSAVTAAAGSLTGAASGGAAGRTLHDVPEGVAVVSMEEDKEDVRPAQSAVDGKPLAKDQTSVKPATRRRASRARAATISEGQTSMQTNASILPPPIGISVASDQSSDGRAPKTSKSTLSVLSSYPSSSPDIVPASTTSIGTESSDPTSPASKVLKPSSKKTVATAAVVAGGKGRKAKVFRTEAQKAEADAKRLSDKRRRRRESHNRVERNRRENINERINELASLLPEAMLLDAIATSTQGGLSASVHAATAARLLDEASNANDKDRPVRLPEDGESIEDPQKYAAALAPVEEGHPLLTAIPINKGRILEGCVSYIRHMQQFLGMQMSRNAQLEAEIVRLHQCTDGVDLMQDRAQRAGSIEISTSKRGVDDLRAATNVAIDEDEDCEIVPGPTVPFSTWGAVNGLAETSNVFEVARPTSDRRAKRPPHRKSVSYSVRTGLPIREDSPDQPERARAERASPQIKLESEEEANLTSSFPAAVLSEAAGRMGMRRSVSLGWREDAADHGRGRTRTRGSDGVRPMDGAEKEPKTTLFASWPALPAGESQSLCGSEDDREEDERVRAPLTSGCVGATM